MQFNVFYFSQLPLKIDIIKHRQEVIGKSTSSHAKIIAPNDVNIYIYPDIPDYSQEQDEVVLIFPSANAVSISSLFKGVSIEHKENFGLKKGFSLGTMLKLTLDEVISDSDKEKLAAEELTDKKYTLDSLPFKKAIFIDSTWKQCRGIYKDPRISSIRSCVIQNRITKFWRLQKGAPKWYLSTIEAIHQFLLEVHISAWGISQKYYDQCLNDLQLDTNFISENKIISEEKSTKIDSLCKPYDGQYDNILYFFKFLYSVIHSLEHINGKLNIYQTDEYK